MRADPPNGRGPLRRQPERAANYISNSIRNAGSPVVKPAVAAGGGGFIRATASDPCPICGHDAWCSITDDGELCICMRESDGSLKPTRNGGWLHRLADGPHQRTADTTILVRPPDVDRMTALHRRQRAWFRGTMMRDLLRDSLRTTDTIAEALGQLGCGWELIPRPVWSWPLYDEHGRIIGLRYRRRDTGDKYCERGSQLGICMPTVGLTAGNNLMLIAEGETDTAAALSLGFEAIGTPGAGQAIPIVAALAQGRDVVIVQDNDVAGSGGGSRLALALSVRCSSVRRIRPPSGLKDLRAWVEAGATREDLLAAIQDAQPIRLTVGGAR